MRLKTLQEMPPWKWPQEAGSQFLEILINSRADTADRLIAAQLAGDITVVNDELVDALLAILQDDQASEKLRGTAAIALGPVLEHTDTSGFEDPDDVIISEKTFRKTQDSLHRLYLDGAIPQNVRRRILEASIRAAQQWHQNAVRAAFASKDEDWQLTATFAMRWIRGFDKQVLTALQSDNQDIHYQAVCAAGNWEIDAAWPHVSNLISLQSDDKPLLLAAIEAVAKIRPQEAGVILVDLTLSEDEEIVEAVHDAMTMAETLSDDVFNDDEHIH